MEFNKIDPMICTHIIYDTLGIDVYGQLNYHNRTSAKVRGDLKNLIDLRVPNPDLKILVSVGASIETFHPIWSTIAASADLRNKFATNVFSFLYGNKLNGIDFDWAYPNKDGKSPKDVANFVLLLKAVKEKLGTAYSVYVSLGVLPERTEQSYNIPAIFNAVDFVILKSYNLYGIGDSKTGLHTVLYDPPYDVDNCVSSLDKYSIAKEKIILGIASFGNVFTLDDPTKTGVGAPAKFSGSAKYYEICQKVIKKALVHWYEREQRSCYACKDTEWVSYEDYYSVEEKGIYIKNNLLGGAMIQTMDYDDYSNLCGDGTFPLIKNIHKELNSIIPTPVTTVGTPIETTSTKYTDVPTAPTDKPSNGH